MDSMSFLKGEPGLCNSVSATHAFGKKIQNDVLFLCVCLQMVITLLIVQSMTFWE